MFEILSEGPKRSRLHTRYIGWPRKSICAPRRQHSVVSPCEKVTVGREIDWSAVLGSFRSSLMLIHPDKDGELPRSSTTWSALNGQTVISLPASNSDQQVIDEHLARNHVATQRGVVVNLLETQIALVEANEGIAIIPSFALPFCRYRKVVMSRLIDPIVNLEFYQISNRGQKLPPAANEFIAFLKTYIARWAGAAGVL